jgi:methylglutaconyl-CoA hydratase
MIYLTKKYAQGVCYLVLSRPEKKNALNKKMIEQIIDYLEETAESTQFRVLVISGKDRFFSAGADLEWMKQAKDQRQEQNIEDARLFNKLYDTLYNYPKPVIVCVEGGAYGGATGLMACADLVTASSDAKFVFSETSIGLLPAMAAPWIVKKTGMAFARSAFLTGLAFSSNEARRHGLVQYVFPQEKIIPKTREIATQIVRNSPQATKEIKILLNRIDRQIVPIDEDLTRYCSTKIAEARTSEEGQEGVNAFFEKRKPSWIQ